jgi:hypothetical protein
VKRLAAETGARRIKKNQFEVLKMKRNPYTPLGPEDSHGSERQKSGNAPAKGEKPDSKKAGGDGQPGQQKRGTFKNSPGRVSADIRD